MPRRTSSRSAKIKEAEINPKQIIKPKIRNKTNPVKNDKKQPKVKSKKSKKQLTVLQKNIENNNLESIEVEDEAKNKLCGEVLQEQIPEPKIQTPNNEIEFECNDNELMEAAILSENLIEKNEDTLLNLQEQSSENDLNLIDKNIENDKEIVNSQSPKNSQEKLSATQAARCERNRQKALLLRQTKLSKESLENSKSSLTCIKEVDSNGGFFIKNDDETASKKIKKVEELPPVIFGDMEICLDCDQPFLDSYLLTTYDYSVCDKCRDSKDKHAVITKTEARESYLLSEVDLTVREPILKFMVKKNPRHNSWGDMKLYLRLQIEQRAMEVWKTPEALEEEHKRREENREKAKQIKFKKKMVKLRKEVRSSLFTKQAGGHIHVYGTETQCEDESDDDMWQKSCKTCGYTLKFEKM